MKTFTTLFSSLFLLMITVNGQAAVENKGYSYSSPKAQARTVAMLKQSNPYAHIKHHTKHKKYHSALDVRHTVSKVSVFFHTKQELVDLRGPGVNGYAISKRDGSCEIHTMMPYNWNDDDAMRTLGHELLHCFGATHEK